MIQRLLPLVVFLLLACLLGAGIWLAAVRDPNAIPSPLVGKPAPAFELPSLHEPSRTVRSEELLGQPYLLNVFGSWCPGCRDEHPVIERLARSGRLPVIGFNWKDERADALRWLAQFGDPYALIVVDFEGRTAIDFGVYGAPESFLIGADGRVLYKHIGPITWADIEQEILPRLPTGSNGAGP
jgi:cytochrome c biogenesis protein CcmG, thiol:disulfide interchange protein DsbE